MLNTQYNFQALKQSVLPPFCLKCGRELTEKKNINEEILVDNNKLEQIATILASKGHNNVAIIGKAGTGKTALVIALSRAISAGRYKALQGRRIVEVDIDALLNGLHTVADKGTRLANLLTEAEQYGIILFFDEGHRLYGDGESNSLSNIMKPFLTRDKLQVIIATTLDEYNFFIARDKAFKRRFEAVLHKEPNAAETFNIVKHVMKNRYSEMTITDSILKELIALGNRYVLDRNNPDKALALLDTVVAWTLNRSDKENITSEILREVISARLNVPKSSLNVDIKTGLIGMDEYLAVKFPGWEEVCCKVTKSLNKALTRNLRQYGPLSVTIMCGADVRLMTDIARAAVKKLGCVGDGAVYTIDVNRADPVDPFVSCVRKNPNAAIIFTGVNAATSPVVLCRLKEVLCSGVLKNSDNQEASYRYASVFVLCAGTVNKSNAMGFISDGSYSIDDEMKNVLTFIGADNYDIISLDGLNADKAALLFDKIFMSQLRHAAKSCRCEADITLADSAKEEIKKKLFSVTAWSNMYKIIEEILLLVMTNNPPSDINIEFVEGKFRAELNGNQQIVHEMR